MNKIFKKIFREKNKKNLPSEKHEKKLFSLVKCEDKEYQEYLRCQLNRTLSKKEQDASSMRTKYLLSRLLDKVNCRIDIKCLCVGCRNIYEIKAFHEMGFKNVTGIDLYSENKYILVMDMHDMKFKDNTFDIVYSAHSLEHAYDTDKAIRELIRIANKNAIFIIEVPINYEIRGADRVDFESLNKLYSKFKVCANINKVFFEEELEKGKANNFSGTEILRTIFEIEKNIYEKEKLPF